MKETIKDLRELIVFMSKCFSLMLLISSLLKQYFFTYLLSLIFCAFLFQKKEVFERLMKRITP